jgi:ankyrin repeat protein
MYFSCCWLQVVKVLAEAGADLNLPENRGWTALMIAASRGCVESIEALLGEQHCVHERGMGLSCGYQCRGGLCCEGQCGGGAVV